MAMTNVYYHLLQQEWALLCYIDGTIDPRVSFLNDPKCQHQNVNVNIIVNMGGLFPIVKY